MKHIKSLGEIQNAINDFNSGKLDKPLLFKKVGADIIEIFDVYQNTLYEICVKDIHGTFHKVKDEDRVFIQESSYS